MHPGSSPWDAHHINTDGVASPSLSPLSDFLADSDCAPAEDTGEVSDSSPANAAQIEFGDSLFRLPMRPSTEIRQHKKRGRKRASLADLPSAAESRPSSSSQGMPCPQPSSQPPHAKQSQPPPMPMVSHHALLPLPALGFLIPSSLGPALSQATANAQCQDTPLDEVMLKLADQYLSASYHLASWKILQQQLQMNSTSLSMRLKRLAAALTIQQHTDRAMIEGQVTQHCPSQALIMYVDRCTYDETPMYTAVQDDPAASTSAPPSHPDIVLPPSIALMKSMQTGAKFSAGTAKLLQFSSGYSLLIQHKGRHLLIMGETYSPLSVISSTSTPVMQTSLQRLNGTTAASQAFGFKVRSVVTDKHPANTKAEQIISQQRGGSWSPIHVHCALHVIANAHVRTFESLMPHHTHRPHQNSPQPASTKYDGHFPQGHASSCAAEARCASQTPARSCAEVQEQGPTTLLVSHIRKHGQAATTPTTSQRGLARSQFHRMVGVTWSATATKGVRLANG